MKEIVCLCSICSEKLNVFHSAEVDGYTTIWVEPCDNNFCLDHEEGQTEEQDGYA